MIEPHNGYRTYEASYRSFGGFGTWRNIHAIVVAENEKQALTWAVMTYQDTDPKEWEFVEIDTATAGCNHIQTYTN